MPFKIWTIFSELRSVPCQFCSEEVKSLLESPRMLLLRSLLHFQHLLEVGNMPEKRRRGDPFLLPLILSNDLYFFCSRYFSYYLTV